MPHRAVCSPRSPSGFGHHQILGRLRPPFSTLSGLKSLLGRTKSFFELLIQPVPSRTGCLAVVASWQPVPGATDS